VEWLKAIAVYMTVGVPDFPGTDMGKNS